MFYHIFSLTSAYTIFILCILFLVIAIKNKNHHMLLWGFSGFCYSLMFLLDSFADTFFFSNSTLLILRQLLSIISSCFFLHGTFRFFQKQVPSYLNIVTCLFCILTLLQNTHVIFAKIIIIPNLIFASGLIIISGLMFLLYSWDESFPEKIWTGVLLLLWSVLMNQTGFADTRDSLTGVIHHMGIFTLTCLIVLLILVSDKKTQLVMQQLSDRLKISEQKREKMLENISHEIKTPITLIQGYTETLLQPEIPLSIQKDYLHMLYSKAHMLATLADDFSRVMSSEPKDVEYRFYEYPAKNIFSPLINQCRDQAIRSGYQFSLDESWNPDVILVVDIDRIQQAVSNLMNNALRHTPAKSSILIQIKTKTLPKESFHDPLEDSFISGILQFSICDEGTGFSSSELSKIFERNYSRGNDVSSHAHGAPFSGLGLYITKNIIEAHNGNIHAKNRSHGGACVWFELPFFIE